MPDESTRQLGASRLRSDLCIVLTALLACYVVSMALNLNESSVAMPSRYERWQLDELPLTGAVFALGLAWYAMRRRFEGAWALRLRSGTARAQPRARAATDRRARERASDSMKSGAHRTPRTQGDTPCRAQRRLAAFRDSP